MEHTERLRITNTADKFAQSLCSVLNNIDELIRLSPAKGYISAFDIFNLVEYRARNNTFVLVDNFDVKVNETINSQIEFNELWSGNETQRQIEKAISAKKLLNQRKPMNCKEVCR